MARRQPTAVRGLASVTYAGARLAPAPLRRACSIGACPPSARWSSCRKTIWSTPCWRWAPGGGRALCRRHIAPVPLVSYRLLQLRHVLETVTPGMVFAADAPPIRPRFQTAVGADIRGGVDWGELPKPPPRRLLALATAATPPVDGHGRHQARRPSQVPPAARPSCPGGDQHQPACGAPTSSRCRSRHAGAHRGPPVLVTGCPGTTPSVATTTSAWWSTTAARCTSTTASPRQR